MEDKSNLSHDVINLHFLTFIQGSRDLKEFAPLKFLGKQKRTIENLHNDNMENSMRKAVFKRKETVLSQFSIFSICMLLVRTERRVHLSPMVFTKARLEPLVFHFLVPKRPHSHQYNLPLVKFYRGRPSCQAPSLSFAARKTMVVCLD